MGERQVMFVAKSGYTGHLFEEEVIGTPKIVSWQADGRRWKVRGCVEFAHRHQLTQHGPIAEQLRLKVAERLGVDGRRVLIYNTINTPFDFYLGADCFFEFQGTVVTCDASLRNKGSYKADVQIGEAIIGQDGEPNQEEINRLADQIAGQWHRNFRRFREVCTQRQGGGVLTWHPT